MRLLPLKPSHAPALLLAALIGPGASVTALAGAYGPLDATQDPTRWIKNCLVYATESVTLPGNLKIFAGPDDIDTFRSDVCAVLSLTLGGTSAAAVPKEATKLVDVALAAQTIFLEKKSKSSDCVWDTNLGALVEGANVSKVCPEQQPVDLTGMPTDISTVIPFPTIAPGASPADDLDVPQSETYELYLTGPTCMPSADADGCAVAPFGRITLNLNSTIRLMEAGSYQALSIATSGSSTRSFIEVAQERTSLLVKEYMLMGHRSNVNVDDTRLFKVFVEGIDANNVANWSASETAYSFRGDGAFNACYVYSPNGTQTWRGKPTKQRGYKTQVFTKAIVQDTNLNIIFEHPQDEECFALETDCACISQSAVPMLCDSATGAVRIEAINAYDKSVGELLFLTEDALLPAAPTTTQLRDASCFSIPGAELTFNDTTRDSIITPDIFDPSDIQTACGTPENLVPYIVGPVDPAEGPDVPVSCFSTYQDKRLNIPGQDMCNVVDP